MRKQSKCWRLVYLCSRKGRLRNRFPILLVVPCSIGFFVIFLLFTTLSDKTPSAVVRSSDLELEPKQDETLENPQLFKITRPSQNKMKGNLSLVKIKLRTTPIQPDWQTVGGTMDKFYVYSAYYIDLPIHTVRIIGAGKTKGRHHLQCRLYDSSGSHFNTTTATIRIIRENWNLKYSACFVICNLSPVDHRPEYVSVTSSVSKFSVATNLLRVAYVQRNSQSDEFDYSDNVVDFAACVKPIHFNYDNILQFLEWMEFHKLMGVTHFTFYNHTIGDKVACLLQTVYRDQVTVLPWQLPIISQKEIRTEGLFAAINDCIYRRRGTTRHLIVVDLDEMIVPNRAKNYYQLLVDVNIVANKRNIGAYSFQNAFFYLQWPSDLETLTRYNFTNNFLAANISQQLTTLQKLRRRSRLHPHKQRSKYICNPDKIVEAGNHFIWEMTPGYSTVLVPHHLAILHHYRLCEFGGNQCTKNPSLIDKSMVPFGHSLAIGVAQQVELVRDTCSIL